MKLFAGAALRQVCSYAGSVDTGLRDGFKWDFVASDISSLPLRGLGKFSMHEAPLALQSAACLSIWMRQDGMDIEVCNPEDCRGV